jgi:hypothetical protein
MGHNRLGVDAAKAWVHLAADFEHLAARSLEDPLDLATSGAEHRIDNHPGWVIGDQVEVDELPQMVIVSGRWIESIDPTLGPRLLIIHGVRPSSAALIVIEIDLNAAALLGERRAGIGRALSDAQVGAYVLGANRSSETTWPVSSDSTEQKYRIFFSAAPDPMLERYIFEETPMKILNCGWGEQFSVRRVRPSVNSLVRHI